MAKTAQIRARVEPELKKEAEGILSTLGVSPTEAIRLFYRQVVLMGGIPFSVRIPSEATLATMERTDRGEDIQLFSSSDEMFEKLGI